WDLRVLRGPDRQLHPTHHRVPHVHPHDPPVDGPVRGGAPRVGSHPDLRGDHRDPVTHRVDGPGTCGTWPLPVTEAGRLRDGRTPGRLFHPPHHRATYVAVLHQPHHRLPHSGRAVHDLGRDLTVLPGSWPAGAGRELGCPAPGSTEHPLDRRCTVGAASGSCGDGGRAGTQLRR